MLFYRIDEKYWPALKTFLIFLNYMPEVVYDIGEINNNIISADITIDLEVARSLREI
jgi:hypothetical protein